MKAYGKIKSFTDLNTWKEAHKLVLMVYKESRKFPEEEKFGLTSQIRRAVVSITSNIAEGFTMASSKEKVRFYRISAASLTEMQNQLLIAKDLSYLNKNDFGTIADKTITVSKLLAGLTKSAGRTDKTA